MDEEMNRREKEKRIYTGCIQNNFKDSDNWEPPISNSGIFVYTLEVYILMLPKTIWEFKTSLFDGKDVFVWFSMLVKWL